MKVPNFNLLSDFCMLTAKLVLGSKICHDENICSDDTLERLAPDRFVWSERSKSNFRMCFVILFLCFLVLLVLRLPRLGKRELFLVLFVRLFDLCLFGFVGFLFFLGSGKGCGL